MKGVLNVMYALLCMKVKCVMSGMNFMYGPSACQGGSRGATPSPRRSPGGRGEAPPGRPGVQGGGKATPRGVPKGCIPKPWALISRIWALFSRIWTNSHMIKHKHICSHSVFFVSSFVLYNVFFSVYESMFL